MTFLLWFTLVAWFTSCILACYTGLSFGLLARMRDEWYGDMWHDPDHLNLS